MSILITGGAGYIGSHTSVELLNAGYDIVIVDNLYNSKLESINRIKELSGKDFPFYKCDILDKEGLSKIFTENSIDAVIHFAGLKAVGESVAIPLTYYHNNITGTLVLCEVMKEFGVRKIVFSSSATVYGNDGISPLDETMQTGGCTNPYGSTKYMIEIILKDLYTSDNDWSIALLRYFNPIGAHESGRIGEDPNGIPNNLMPYISQVAIGKLPVLSVYGNDYDTPDGTGVRDYIHVVDLAKGHLKAVEFVVKNKGCDAYNLGTGTGYSVVDLVSAFEKASGIAVKRQFAPRRAGDIAVCYSNPEKAKKILGWEALYDVERMCADTWRWQKNNPNGF